MERSGAIRAIKIMALDYETILCQKQAITVKANSEHTIAINVFQGQNEGPSKIPFFVRVDEAFATTTAVNFEIIGSNAEDMSNPIVIDASGDIAVNDLVPGFVWKGYLNHHKPVKYLALRSTPDTDATAGSITAAFSLYNTQHAGIYKSAGEIQIN